MMSKAAGGEFAGAYAALAAARGRRNFGPSPANAFPAYTTIELRRDLDSDKLDGATRAKIEAEIARRENAKAARKARKSEAA